MTRGELGRFLAFLKAWERSCTYYYFPFIVPSIVVSDSSSLVVVVVVAIIIIVISAVHTSRKWFQTDRRERVNAEGKLLQCESIIPGD